MYIFLSYNFNDEKFTRMVHYYLKKQPKIRVYCYYHDKHAKEEWGTQVDKALMDCDTFVLLYTRKLGNVQRKEYISSLSPKTNFDRLIFMQIRNAPSSEDGIAMAQSWAGGIIESLDEKGALKCAKEIVHLLKCVKWVSIDGLPIGYPFSYEKVIVEQYAKNKGEIDNEWIDKGCPRIWPEVPRRNRKDEGKEDVFNPCDPKLIGFYRDWDVKSKEVKEPRVLPAILTEKEYNIHDLLQNDITFPEAGPRKFHYYPSDDTKKELIVGILVSGGIAPGINAVIEGIVKRHYLYSRYGGKYKIKVLGVNDGLKGLLRDGVANFQDLTPEIVENKANLGGSMIGTSREDKFLSSDPELKRKNIREVFNKLSSKKIEILYIIGGDGSMRVARVLQRYFEKHKESKKPISIVAIPKTMDNDILWVWQSFGFMSAVERARDAINVLATESKSNPRLCVIQLFGSDSGFVASHAALASGVCDAVLIPEVPFSIEKIFAHIKRRLDKRTGEEYAGRGPYGLVTMAETAIPTDIGKYVPELRNFYELGSKSVLENQKIVNNVQDEQKVYNIGLTPKEIEEIKKYLKNDGYTYGQTPDKLRSGCLKIISKVLQQKINDLGYLKGFRVFTNEPRHLIRSIPPSASDIIFGNRLGTLSVDGAMAGYYDFMISQWLTEYVMVPLELVVLGRKRIPRSGVFWKSVRSSTGQEDETEEKNEVETEIH